MNVFRYVVVAFAAANACVALLPAPEWHAVLGWSVAAVFALAAAIEEDG